MSLYVDLSTDPETGQAINAEVQPLAGFWKRIFAFCVDLILLFLFGMLISWPLSKFFVLWGVWANLVGLLVFLIYFGFLNSAKNDGQTFGKMIFHIRVTDKTGKPVSVGKSVLRAFILYGPWLLGGILGASWPNRFWNVIFALSVSLDLIIIYLYFFNFRTRQSLHDLISKTYVVRDDLQTPVGARPVWKLHYAILVLLICVEIFGVQLLYDKESGKVGDYLSWPTRSLIALFLKNNPEIGRINFSTGIIFDRRLNARQRYLAVDLYLRHKPENNLLAEAFAREIAGQVRMKRFDILRVDLRYEFNIGIFSYSLERTYLLDLKNFPLQSKRLER